jgi:hypothetical protein
MQAAAAIDAVIEGGGRQFLVTPPLALLDHQVPGARREIAGFSAFSLLAHPC